MSVVVLGDTDDTRVTRRY